MMIGLMFNKTDVLKNNQNFNRNAENEKLLFFWNLRYDLKF